MDFNDVKRFQIPTIDWPFGTNAHEVRDMGGNILWQEQSQETYTILTYIESTGTQYIDTGWKPTLYENGSVRNYHLRLQLSLNSVATNTPYFLLGGCTNLRMYINKTSAWGNPTVYGRYNMNSWASGTGGAVNANTKYNATLNSSGAQINSRGASMNPLSQYINPTYSLKLFYDDGNNRFTAGRIYDFYILDNDNNGSYVMHLKPARRDSDGAIGMYDEDNDVFYPNAGTGTFNYA